MDWKNKFFELMFSVKINYDDVSSAKKLKFDNIPIKLYKYCSFDENENINYDLLNLQNNNFYFKSPIDFNDPYDCLFCLQAEKFTRVSSFLIKIIPKLVKVLFVGSRNQKHYVDAFQNAINNEKDRLNSWLPNSYRNSVFVSCFSENLKSILMWSHYSNKHKGFCIEYNFKELPIDDLRSIFMFPVNYTSNFIDLTKYFKPNKKVFNVFVFEYAAITKSIEWEYEKEWRIVFGHGQIDKPTEFRAPNATAVYIGAKADGKLESELKDICSKKNINLFKMELSKNSYELIYKTI